MAVYTIHQPPLRKGETSPDPDRFVLVRDGFYFWAFVFGPIWMIWRRLWLTLVLYIVAITGLEIGLRVLGVGAPMRMLVMLAVALLVGLEAATLQRWTLGRRGWKNVGVVVGDDVESAERRFFATWIDGAQPAAQSDAGKPPAAPRMQISGGSDVLGLFPEADKPR
jgi:hypothetical protein